YKMVSTEVKNYLKGLYGSPPGKIDEDLRHKVLGDETPITRRPADLLEPGMEKARKEIEPYLKKEEDVLSYILFPNVAVSFFKRRCGEEPPLRKGAREEKREAVEGGKVSLDYIYGVDHDLIGSISGNLYYPA
ncbi:MAG: hypothetical protein GX887_00140, partial [Firmicutes bacterium]|nr:hypothetical protein [Bacillota bacterium]